MHVQEIDWIFAPSGQNLCKGVPFANDSNGALWATDGLGKALKKAKFIEYTDESFEQKVKVANDEVHLGILGPLIRATPGDIIEITLKNDLDFDLLLDPQGLVPISVKEHPSPLGPVAHPGKTVKYVWYVPQEASPGPEGPETNLLLYHSVVYSEASDNAGLIGPILVSREGAPAEPEEGRDVITMLQIFNENVSPFYEENLGSRTYSSVGLDSEQALEESLMKHTVNGYIFCNVPGINMTLGENVRWHVASLGSEGDMHTSHWHGNTFLMNGHRGDHVKMVPGTIVSLDFFPRSAGTWLYHCHVNDHIHAGEDLF